MRKNHKSELYRDIREIRMKVISYVSSTKVMIMQLNNGFRIWGCSEKMAYTMMIL